MSPDFNRRHFLTQAAAGSAMPSQRLRALAMPGTARAAQLLPC